MSHVELLQAATQDLSSAQTKLASALGETLIELAGSPRDPGLVHERDAILDYAQEVVSLRNRIAEHAKV